MQHPGQQPPYSYSASHKYMQMANTYLGMTGGQLMFHNEQVVGSISITHAGGKNARLQHWLWKSIKSICKPRTAAATSLTKSMHHNLPPCTLQPRAQSHSKLRSNLWTMDARTHTYTYACTEYYKAIGLKCFCLQCMHSVEKATTH